MMKTFKKRGALTHFQILSEISKQDPHLKQKDLADKLGITIQAVSENIKILIKLGYITSKDGRSPYKITQAGIDKVKKDAITLRKYSDSVLETMNYYKTIWPAIAKEKLEKDDIVGLFMEDGILYAHKKEENATGIVLEDAEKNMDVSLTNLTGIIDMDVGEVTVITVPPIKDGGSKASDLDLIKNIYKKGTNTGKKIDKIAVAGTVSRAIVNKLNLKIDIEYAAAHATANAARKVVGKKQMSKIPALRDKVLEQAKSSCLGHYVWACGIGPQMGYSFSIIHALAYSFIGFQTMYIATRWNPIYWNTACLIVNSGSLEDEDIYEEDEDGFIISDKKEKATDYGKVAKAIGDIITKGIRVSLVDINKSNYSFEPDVENNEILFGMKALSNVGGPVIEQIIAHRPYTGIKDFMLRCPLNKSAMFSLIKA